MALMEGMELSLSVIQNGFLEKEKNFKLKKPSEEGNVGLRRRENVLYCNSAKVFRNTLTAVMHMEGGPNLGAYMELFQFLWIITDTYRMLELNRTLEIVLYNPLILHFTFSMRIEFAEIWPVLHYSEAKEICGDFK